MAGFYLFYENKQLLLSPGSSYTIGRDPSCDIVLENTHVSRKHASLEYGHDGFALTDLDSTNGTWFEGKKTGTILRKGEFSFRLADSNLSIRSASPGDTMLFEKKISGILEKVEDNSLLEDIGDLRRLYNQKKENLSEMAFRDTLTRLYNRRWFDTKLAEETERAARYKHPLSLLMIDIDHFKKFNDTWGHQKGDEVLAVVAGLLKRSVRSSDIICRYGGEEIAVILPETAGRQGLKVADTCRTRVEGLSAKQTGVTVTVSIGVACLTAGWATPEKLIKNADSALYTAKETGRNKVCLYEGNENAH
jgi:diguanylate cyclase (GGDEF)-like protein